MADAGVPRAPPPRCGPFSSRTCTATIISGCLGCSAPCTCKAAASRWCIIGPPGLDEVLVTQARVSRKCSWASPWSLRARRYRGPRRGVRRRRRCTVWSLPMRHRMPCAGYLFEEQPRRANLLKEKLPAGLTPAQLARLAQGDDLPADEQQPGLRHADVSPARAPTPRRYAFFADTLYTPALARSFAGADLLYHEATFLDELRGARRPNPPQHRPPGRPAGPGRRRETAAARPLFEPLQGPGAAAARGPAGVCQHGAGGRAGGEFVARSPQSEPGGRSTQPLLRTRAQRA